MNIFWVTVLSAAMLAAIGTGQDTTRNSRDRARRFGFGNVSPSSGNVAAGERTRTASPSGQNFRTGVAEEDTDVDIAGPGYAQNDHYGNRYGGGYQSPATPTTTTLDEDDPAHRKKVLQDTIKRVGEWARTRVRPATADTVVADDEKQQKPGPGNSRFGQPKGDDELDDNSGSPSPQNNRRGRPAPPSPPRGGGGGGGGGWDQQQPQPSRSREAPSWQSGGGGRGGGNFPQQQQQWGRPTQMQHQEQLADENEDQFQGW